MAGPRSRKGPTTLRRAVRDRGAAPMALQEVARGAALRGDGNGDGFLHCLGMEPDLLGRAMLPGVAGRRCRSGACAAAPGAARRARSEGSGRHEPVQHGRKVGSAVRLGNSAVVTLNEVKGTISSWSPFAALEGDGDETCARWSSQHSISSVDVIVTDIWSAHAPFRARPRAAAPLPSAELHILLALLDAERHGYAIKQEVAERTAGEVQLGPGTLYGAIKRMLASGTIRKRPAPGRLKG